tara:strand:+ start:1020 stop:1517 length:498 start_codon:yes stop_codon:yes gene_type:complete
MILNKLKKNFFVNSSIILLIFLLDRISKVYCIYLSDKISSNEIFFSKYLNIYLTWNDGIAFGMLSFNESYLYNILTIVILIVIVALMFMTINTSGFKKYSMLMILGGAFGNFFDRIFYKAVPDFIDFHVGNFHWFIFNVADIFISLGIFFMIFFELIGNSEGKLK